MRKPTVDNTWDSFKTHFRRELKKPRELRINASQGGCANYIEQANIHMWNEHT